MPTNIRDLRISTNGIARVSAEHVERLARHQLRADDIVYSRRGDVEKCALVTPEQDSWLCGTGCLLVRVASPQVDARYLAYALSLPETRDWITSHAVGATMPNLNTEVLREVPVSLPPIEQQRAIAATLGALDDKIESNRRAIGLMEQLDATLLDKRLGLDVYGFPAYDQRSLGDLLAVVETGSRPRGGVGISTAGVVSLGAESIQSAGVVATTQFKRVPSEYVASMRRERLADGDVLVYKDGGTPGNFRPHVSAFGYGALADGIFAGIRNPLSHESEHEMTEQRALEYLAALSVLARWVDESSVQKV